MEDLLLEEETEQNSMDEIIETVDYNLLLDILLSIERYQQYMLGILTFMLAVMLVLLFAVAVKKDG